MNRFALGLLSLMFPILAMAEIPCFELSEVRDNRPWLVTFGHRSSAVLAAKAAAEQAKLQGFRVALVMIPYKGDSLFKSNPKARLYADEIIEFDSPEADPSEVIKRVRALGTIRSIEPGNDEWVPLARRVREDLRLNLPKGNRGPRPDPNDKYTMSETLKKHGLRHVRQTKAKNLNEVLKFIQTAGLRPSNDKSSYLILKPINSSGSNGFTEVFGKDGQIDAAEIEAKLATLLKMTNDKGEPITEVLVQEALKGVEYAVNFLYSRDEASGDEHWVNYAIWRYKKRPGRIYDYDRAIIDISSKRVRDIHEYTMAALKVLQLDPGAIHAEIIFTQNGPVLIDVGNRLMGSSQPRLESFVAGIDIPTMNILAHTDFKKFKELMPNALPQPRMHAALLTLTNLGAPTVLREDAQQLLELVRKRPSVRMAFFDAEPGVLIPTAKNLFVGAYGQVEFAHETYEVLMQDLEFVRNQMQFLRKP